MRYSTDVVGDSHIFAEQRGIRGFKDQVADLVTRAGRAAEAEMLARVPRGDGANDSGTGTIAGSIRVLTEARFDPGGAGGGGFWRVAVGPGPEAPTHLRYVLEGTGVHGPVGNLIRPRSRRALAFSDAGGEFVRAYSKGQKPQTEWLTQAREAADAYIEAGMRSLELRS